VAEALENVYPDNPAQLAVLAYHWAEAGDIPKEAHYAALAGEQALSNGAYQEAINFLEHTLTLSGQVGLSRSQQALHKRQLGDAYLGLGQLSRSQSCLEEGLALLGKMPPKSPVLFVMSLTGQILRHTWHRLKFDLLRRPMKSTASDQELATAARICERLGQLAYIHNDLFALVYYIIKGTNLAEQIGSTAQADLLRGYASMAGTADAVNHRLARMYYHRSQALMLDNSDKEAESWANLVLGLYASVRADWEDVQNRFQRCIQLAQQTGNRRRWGEGTCLLGFTYCLSRWDINAVVRLDYPALSTRQGDLQVRAMLLDIPGEAALRLGRFDESLDLLQQSVILYEQIEDRALLIRQYGLLAQLHLRLGNYGEAQQFADKAATLIAASVPIAFYALEGYAGSTEFSLSLWENQPSPIHRNRVRASLKFMRQFAFLADIVKPRAVAYRGWYHWLDGKPDKARKAGLKGVAEAQRLKMPYDEGVAHYHLGRFLPKDDPQHAEHLKQAAAIFERLGAAWDLERAHQALGDKT
jgi:tetratricopeptide (TPR) repeat protein